MRPSEAGARAAKAGVRVPTPGPPVLGGKWLMLEVGPGVWLEPEGIWSLF